MTGPETTDTDGKQPGAPPAVELTHALEAIEAGAYIVDAQGHIIAVNTRAQDLLGRRAEDLLGQDAHDLLHRGSHGQPLATTQCRMRQAFHAGRPAQGDREYFARADGSLLPVSWMITPYADRKSVV